MRLVKLSTKSPQTVRGITSGDIGKDDDPEKRGLPSFPTRGPKPGASGKTTSKRKGKRRDVGKLSRLPDMPLDIIYDVSYRIVSIANDGKSDNLLDIYRYSLLSTRWIYSEYRGQTRPFASFSQTRLRGRFGSPLSGTSLRINGLLRVPMT